MENPIRLRCSTKTFLLTARSPCLLHDVMHCQKKETRWH
uniref:Uncharacterized protein n=1 Tax=Arundo donax TaxID=35708 RepID=A0A0A9AC92_ARUDO